jgi:hypothetical protein
MPKYTTTNNNNLPNILEIFHSNNISTEKNNFIKFNNQTIILSNGLNFFGLKNDIHLILNKDDLFDIIVNQKYDYLITITNKDLINKAPYVEIYDIINDKKILQLSENKFAIRLWYQLINNNLISLGPPVYIIAYNLKTFIKNTVDQLEKYTKNIHIIDNNSTFGPLVEYYNKDYKYFLHKMNRNLGHNVWQGLIWQFPKIFFITDPDLQFNDNLPDNFIDIMVEFTDIYKTTRIGFALDLSDSELFFQSNDYCTGHSIVNWEKRFWIDKIKDDNYVLYRAAIDTTFCAINQQYFIGHSLSGVRIAGDFTCKHLPWYQNFRDNIPIDEWNYYKLGNTSSTTLKMLNKL